MAERNWALAHGRSLSLGPRARLMAIINVTPDSFSDGGRLTSAEAAIAHGLQAVAEGAEIIDIGGESTRPGAVPVSADEECERVLPVIRGLVARTDALISIDTYRASTARLAIAEGAHIINDVFGAQKEPEIAEVAAATGAGLCLMHTGRERHKLADVIADQRLFFAQSLEIVRKAGVLDEQIVLDPGYGFAKDTVENYDLIRRFRDLHALGYPLLAGTSRKRFIGAATGIEQADQRDVATAATSVMLRERGAVIFRVHNVAINRDALAMTDAIAGCEWEKPGTGA